MSKLRSSALPTFALLTTAAFGLAACGEESEADIARNCRHNGYYAQNCQTLVGSIAPDELTRIRNQVADRIEQERMARLERDRLEIAREQLQIQRERNQAAGEAIGAAIGGLLSGGSSTTTRQEPPTQRRDDYTASPARQTPAQPPRQPSQVDALRPDVERGNSETTTRGGFGASGRPAGTVTSDAPAQVAPRTTPATEPEVRRGGFGSSSAPAVTGSATAAQRTAAQPPAAPAVAARPTPTATPARPAAQEAAPAPARR